jgi:hypothetical protein
MAIGSREAALKERDRAVEARERALAIREKAVDEGLGRTLGDMKDLLTSADGLLGGALSDTKTKLDRLIALAKKEDARHGSLSG